MWFEGHLPLLSFTMSKSFPSLGTLSLRVPLPGTDFPSWNPSVLRKVYPSSRFWNLKGYLLLSFSLLRVPCHSQPTTTDGYILVLLFHSVVPPPVLLSNLKGRLFCLREFLRPSLHCKNLLDILSIWISADLTWQDPSSFRPVFPDNVAINPVR